MGLTGKTKASTYKDILQMDNSNNGIDTTIRTIKDGEGTSSALLISDDQVRILPNNDETTSTFQVRSKAGVVLFTVDSSNSLVKALGNNVNTNYETFSTIFDGFTVNTHIALYNTGHSAGGGEPAVGTGTDPDTSVTPTSSADDYVNCYWYIPDDITIDAVHVLVSDGGSTNKDVRFHLMAYDLDISNGAKSGDLTSGVVVADGADLTNINEDAIDYQSMTIQSANVDSGKVILATVLATNATDKITVNMRVKYHLR